MQSYQILKLIKKINWEYVVKRHETLLWRSITDRCYQYFKKITGIDWNPIYSLRPGEGQLLMPQEILADLRRYISAQKPEFFLKFRKKLLKYVGGLDKLAKLIEKIDCQKLNQNALIALLRRYLQTALYAHNFLVPVGYGINKVLTEKISGLLPTRDPKRKLNQLFILTNPVKENFGAMEKKDFFYLVYHYKVKDKNFNSLLKKHVAKYGLIGARGYWWENAWQEIDVIRRIKIFLRAKKDPIKELKKLQKHKREILLQANRLIKKLKVDRSARLLRRFIPIAREFAYLRTYRTDIIYGSGYRARNLFYEIARRADFNPNDVIYLSYLEVEKMARTKKPPVSSFELNQRKYYCAGFNMANKYFQLSGKTWQKKLEKIFNTKFPKEVTKVKGQTSFVGVVKGKVRIILKVEDLKKFKTGEILMAVMTLPSFVPAMEKARAFVTDDGGILCHAAIVSREMKKPCIIGTKIATKVFKDGDLVEVDANQGIVRKLRR